MGHFGQLKFSNFESPCCSDVSHQVSVNSNQWFGRRCDFANFEMAAILDNGVE